MAIRSGLADSWTPNIWIIRTRSESPTKKFTKTDQNKLFAHNLNTFAQAHTYSRTYIYSSGFLFFQQGKKGRRKQKLKNISSPSPMATV